MAEQGCLVISDITGYSTYLHDAELDHARDTLASLLELLVEHTRSPLVIIELEGDAIFSYAPAGSFRQGQTLLEIIENTYAAFRKALDLMVLNTDCGCNACRLLPSLDLKFFIHHGTFATQEVAGRSKLVGHDVNLIHRLLKNTITQATGLKAYAAYTAPAVENLGLSELVADFPTHTERYDDVGDVVMVLQDMHGVWEAKRQELIIEVRPEEAIKTIEWDYPVPPHILWEYITNPETRAIFVQATEQKLTKGKGERAGVGAEYYCAHGNRISHHTVLDWRPFEQYTTRETHPLPGISAFYTYKLEPLGDGTRLHFLAGKAQGGWPLRTVSDLAIRTMIGRMAGLGAAALEARIRSDLEAGVVVLPEAIELSPEQIQSAAGVSLES